MASTDNRTPIQLFESILKKLHQTYRKDEIDLLCHSCNMDLTIPQITASHVFLGNEFVRNLIKKYKRTPELTYGDPKKISKILQELGYDHQSICDILSNDKIDENILPCYPQVNSVQNSWQEDKSNLPASQTDQKQSGQPKSQNEKFEICG